MTHLLQSVLSTENNNSLFSSGLAQLEKSAGNSGIDAKIIADILEKAHVVMRKLGLDTKDTTARELYQALLSSVKNGTCESILLNSDYVLLPVQGKVISLNLIDVINNAHHQLAFDKQISSHGKRSLRGEIVSRYLGHGRTDDATTKEIASSMGLVDNRHAWFDEWYTRYKIERKQMENETEELR